MKMKIDPAKFGKFKAGGRGLQRQMVRLFRTWLHDPQTLDWLYGPAVEPFGDG